MNLYSIHIAALLMSNIQNEIGSQNRSRTQKRWHDRMAKPEIVTISYMDSVGRSRVNKCRILDISRLGMSIALQDRVELRSFVHINCPALKLNGNASVRRQVQGAVGYNTGLEFVGGLTYVEPKVASPEITVSV